ncbi:tyrosinase [Ceratobasidium sp. AG-Ba]|nr:tyrosinase [Ceratobasidium sp. AG-Ba]
MSAPYLITGASVGVTKPEGSYQSIELYLAHRAHTYLDIAYRYEINKLKDKLHQFTLFVLAWEKIRGENYKPEAAQFQQIGGIHGMPYTPWIGDPDQVRQTVRGTWLGYCNHASILFPNWHRPYVMLLEQAISEVAYGIAGKYAAHVGPNTELGKQWLLAAKQLRFPYWDWTLPSTGKSGLPEIFIQKEVTILKQDGTKCQHLNPLNHYAFTHRVDGFNNRLEVPEWQHLPDSKPPPQQMAYFKEWTRTYRRPNSSPINVQEDYKALNADLKDPDPKQTGSWAELTSDVSNMFIFPVNIQKDLRANAWDQFSNTTFQSGRASADGVIHSPYDWHATPIEQPHNHVHLIVGGIGHMADNDTAGFDPIFFLHHCNVDRLLSFWEYIYPEYAAGTDGYLDVDGTTRVPFVDAKSPLMPFRKADYTYWDSADTHGLDWVDPNSNDPRYAQNKNYTYEPIGPVNLSEKHLTLKKREQLRGYLQNHFGFKPRPKKGLIPGEYPKFYRTPGHTSATAPQAAQQAAHPGHHVFSKLDGYRHFIVEASLSPRYHTGSYTLKVVAEISGYKYTIGSISVLSRGNSANCGNCQGRRAVDARVRGVVRVPQHIVHMLLEPGSSEPIPTPELAEDEDVPVGTKHGRLSKDAPLNSLQKTNSAAPVIRLLSSDAHQLQVDSEEEKETAPFNLVDWQDHGLLYGAWVQDSEQ